MSVTTLVKTFLYINLYLKVILTIFKFAISLNTQLNTLT